MTHLAANTQQQDDARPPERRRIPPAARGRYLAAVREAWHVARDAHDARHPRLALALAAYARDGRARGATVGMLLHGLDVLVRSVHGGDGSLDFGDAREWGGSVLIRSYYGSA